MNIRRATTNEQRAYTVAERRMLYGWITIDGIDCPIDSLDDREWMYELRAPEGYLFDGDVSGLLCENIKDVRRTAKMVRLEKIISDLPPGAQLFAIDITGIIVQPEPVGRGWQAHVEGNKGRWSRGDSIDEAVGSLIRRLAVEHEGANWRREKG